MATVIALSKVTEAIANARTRLLVTVTNTGASALTLESLQVSDASQKATIEQPNILTPNVALDTGNPSILPGASLSVVFGVVFPAPSLAGVSPNAPGPLGVSGMSVGQPGNSSYTLQAQCQTSDGAVASTSLVVPVLSATAPFPRPEGGAFQFNQGGNLINGIIMGAL